MTSLKTVTMETNCTSVFVFFSKSSGRNNAKYAFQYTFNNDTTQYAKKGEEEKKEQFRDLQDDIRGGCPSSS